MIKKLLSFIYKEVALASIILFLVSLYGSQVTHAAGNFDNKSIAGDYLAADFASRVGDIEKASFYYSAALSKDKNNFSLFKKALETLVILGNFDKAAKLAEQYSNLGNDDSLVSLLRAVNKARKSDFEGTYNIFADLKRKKYEENDIVSHLIMIWADMGRRNYTSALLELEKLSENSEATQIVTYHRALVNEVAGFKDKAGEDFDKLAGTQQPFRTVMEAVRFYNKNGEQGKAVKLIDDFVQANPVFEITDADRKGEIREYSVEERSKRSMAEIILELGGGLYGKGEIDNAAYCFRLALVLDNSLDDGRVLLGGIFEKKQRYDLANDIYAEIPPDSRFYWKSKIGVALNEYRAGNIDKAKSQLLAMAEVNKEKHDPLLSLGDILLAKEKYTEAAEIYSKAVTRIKEPKKGEWNIFYARGICYERMDKWEEAEKDFTKALELDPDQPDVLNYLAYSWLMMDRNIEKAEEMLKVAIEERPDDPHIIDSYGWALFKQGKYDDALEYIEKANMIMPYDPTTNDHLGDIYWHTKRYSEAKFQWKRALDLGPEPEEIERIQRKLDEGIRPIASISVKTSESASTNEM